MYKKYFKHISRTIMMMITQAGLLQQLGPGDHGTVPARLARPTCPGCPCCASGLLVLVKVVVVMMIVMIMLMLMLPCHDSLLPRLWASAPSVSATESNAGSFPALQKQNREQRTLPKQNRELRKRLHRAQKTRYMGGREYKSNKDERQRLMIQV